MMFDADVNVFGLLTADPQQNMLRGEGARTNFSPLTFARFPCDLLSGESYSASALTDVPEILSGSNNVAFQNRLQPVVPPPHPMTLLEF